MHLNCPECTTEITADGINIVKAIAICKNCDNLFQFEEKLEELEFERNRELPALPRFEVIPPGIELLRLSTSMELMINWRKSGKNFTFFFALMWNAIISIFVVAFFFVWEFMMFLFLVPFLLVGVYLIYASVGYLINTSYINVNEHNLSVEHKPLNFLIQRDKYYAIQDIKQFFVKREVLGTVNDNPVYGYTVEMILKNNERISLVKQMHSHQHALFIEEELEYFLNIKNKRVEGEFFRD